MQVLPRREGLDQALVAGEVGHDPHLDLAVVRRHQRLVARADDERLPDPPALGGADRDVLQVRVGRGEPAGGGDRLLERRVDAAGVVDHRQQPVDDRAQPGDVAVAEQVLHERVPGLLEQPGQRVGVGGVAGLVLLRLGQAQLVEEHRLQLLGRAEVHLAADDGVALGGRGGDGVGELPLQLLQVVDVGGDAAVLHRGEHPGQRQLDAAEQGVAAALAEHGLERVGEVVDRDGLEDVGVRGLGGDVVLARARARRGSAAPRARRRP